MTAKVAELVAHTNGHGPCCVEIYQTQLGYQHP